MILKFEIRFQLKFNQNIEFNFLVITVDNFFIENRVGINQVDS
jgi:hypothetical protein